jgi:hypothetical protein
LEVINLWEILPVEYYLVSGSTGSSKSKQKEKRTKTEHFFENDPF